MSTVYTYVTTIDGVGKWEEKKFMMRCVNECDVSKSKKDPVKVGSGSENDKALEKWKRRENDLRPIIHSWP